MVCLGGCFLAIQSDFGFVRFIEVTLISGLLHCRGCMDAPENYFNLASIGVQTTASSSKCVRRGLLSNRLIKPSQQYLVVCIDI